MEAVSAVVDKIVVEDVWQGLYGESWKGLICDEAFAHPAKFSRALIRRIYDHVIAEGWAIKGDSVVDPFGGVALGGFDAMRHGLNWYGCELEAKFVGLGSQNIALWNERFSRMPNWGTARLLQGDSRKLVDVLNAAECCVSSPPYITSINQNDQANDHAARSARKIAAGVDMTKSANRGGPNSVLNHDQKYGDDPAQLGAMKEGDLNLAISSPPYANQDLGGGDGQRKLSGSYSAEKNKATKNGRGLHGNYGATEGQLGAMPEGQLCVTSPPYNPPMSQDHNGSRGGQRGTTPSEKGAFVKYGTSEGQLEGMSTGGFECAVSSPPWEAGAEGKLRKEKFKNPEEFAARMAAGKYRNGKTVASVDGRLAQMERDSGKTYGDSVNNLGNQSGETFWSASRLILEQLHQVIVPGGHAVFVVKAFVRDKKIVDFPGQWAQLCEAVGFRLLHHHRASLVEHSGTQGGFREDKEIKVERKSFFRRLAEAKGSPRIDHESVLCFERA
jgi:hypothetical protein